MKNGEQMKCNTLSKSVKMSCLQFCQKQILQVSETTLMKLKKKSKIHVAIMPFSQV